MRLQDDRGLGLEDRVGVIDERVEWRCRFAGAFEPEGGEVRAPGVCQ